MALLLVASLITMLDLPVGASIALYFLIAGGVAVALMLDQPVRFHPMYLVLLAYLLAYPLSALVYEAFPPPRGQMTLASSELQPAMLWSVRGFAAMSVVFVMFHLLAKKRVKREPRPVNRRILFRLVYLVGAAAILGRILEIAFFGLGLTFIEQDRAAVDSPEGSLAIVINLLISLTNPFLAAFFMMRAKGLKSMSLTWLAGSLGFFVLLEIISVGSKGAILAPIVSVITGVLVGTVQIRMRTLAMLIMSGLAVSFSFSIVTEYRDLLHSVARSGGDVSSFEVQANEFGTAVLRSLPFSNAKSARETNIESQEIGYRFGASLFSFSHLLRVTNGESPYENAWSSLLVPLYAISPRAILDKPVFFNSGENARRYYRWSYGGISVSMIGSFYYAWGYTGIILGMAAFGVILAWVLRPLAIDPISKMPSALLGVAILIFAIQPDMTFQAVSTNLVRLLIGLAALKFMARISWNPRSGSGQRAGTVSRIGNPGGRA